MYNSVVAVFVEVRFWLMINDNPALKPIYYAFMPSRLAITVVKSIPVGVALKVIDDMEAFDISKKCVLSVETDEKRDPGGDRGELQGLHRSRRVHIDGAARDRARHRGQGGPAVQSEDVQE